MTNDSSAPPAFITVALLYKKHARSGKVLYFGKWNKLRLYLFEREDRQPKDGAPMFELAVRAEDYSPKDGAPKGDK